MSAIVKIERQGTGAVFRASLAPNRAYARATPQLWQLIVVAGQHANLGGDLRTFVTSD
jgi:hypothetical protein